MRQIACLVAALLVAVCLVAGQTTTPCSPPGTPTCDPNGNPVAPGPAPFPVPGPVPGPSPNPIPAPETALTVTAVTATVTLGAGRTVVGAQGIAVDPTTGLVYIGLNGTIVSGCAGDGSMSGGSPALPGAGAHRMSIVDPAQGRELAAVTTGSAPIWPTIHPTRRLVYMMGSGDGTVTVHNAGDGSVVGTIPVGGRPHMGGLDYTTGLMVVGNTVRSSNVITEQNHASIVNTATNTIARAFETSPAPHGVVVDQERHLAYFSAVGDGAIVAVNAESGQTLFSGIPKSAYGADFGGNNMLARQAATRRLFQVNTQRSATGIIVVDEVTLAAEKVIALGGTNPIPWGLAVDEPNRLLFAALPSSNAVAVVDLDTLTHAANIPVGTCPYAVAVDPQRRIAVTSNQGSPTQNASASILNMCPVYSALGRVVAGCPIAP